MANLREVKTIVKTGNKKNITGWLRGNRKGRHKRYGKFYLVTCTDTSYILYLSVNIFSVTHALTEVFNVTPGKESLVLKKKSNILIFEERLDHGNGNGYL